MFERFTDHSRRVIVLAQEEARRLNHNYIGTEHVLLGVSSEREGIGAEALVYFGVTLDNARRVVAEIVGRGSEAPSGHIPFTPRAKRALERALREAVGLKHDHIATEHLLLGLLGVQDGTAVQVLERLGLDIATLRALVLELRSNGPSAEGATTVAGRAQVAVGVGRRPRVGRPRDACTVCGRDLWDAQRYVRAANGFLCDTCVADAAGALESSRDRIVVLPPRGFGSPPPSRDDLADIQRAFTEGFGGDVSRIQDGEQLASVGEQVAANHPGLTAEYIVERVRMDGPDDAEVAFTLFVQPLGVVISETGHVRRVDGRWLVARETYLAVMARGAGRLQE